MGSSAKNYLQSGDKWIIGGEIELVGDGQITKDGQPVIGGDGGGGLDIPDGSITDAKLANPKVSKAGDTMTGLLELEGGLDFKDAVVTDPTDLSKHIKLHNNEWGISIQSGNFNLVADPATSNVFNFYQGDTKIGTVQLNISDAKALTTKEYVDDKTYDAAAITTGTFAAARIPTLAQSKVTNLTTDLAAKLTATQAAAQADSTAADVAGLVADFNALLAKLRTAGIIAT